MGSIFSGTHRSSIWAQAMLTLYSTCEGGTVMSSIRRASLVGCLLVVLILVVTGSSPAEIPSKINYQGKLTDAATGVPLAGSYDMTFRILVRSGRGLSSKSTATGTIPSPATRAATSTSANAACNARIRIALPPCIRILKSTEHHLLITRYRYMAFIELHVVGSVVAPHSQPDRKAPTCTPQS